MAYVRQFPAPAVFTAACVRVRPAFAGEGRYFVRVPVGTNQERWDAPQQRAEAAAAEAAAEEEGERGAGKERQCVGEGWGW